MIGTEVIETVIEDSILGEMVLIDSKPRSATAVAKTDCTLATINEKRFTLLVQQNPYFALQVMQIMAARLRRWGDKL
jgi:CRP-like cAMP-binding protein